MTYVDQGINAAILDHPPGVLGRGNVRFAVECNVTESVSVDEFHDPFDDADQACENAEDDIGNHAAGTAFVCALRPSNATHLLQELDEGHYQTAEAN